MAFHVAADEVVRVRVGMKHRAERVGRQKDRPRFAYLVNAPAELLKRRDRADRQQHGQQRGGELAAQRRLFLRQKTNRKDA